MCVYVVLFCGVCKCAPRKRRMRQLSVPNAFHLYRRILKVNKRALPASQLKESNQIIKSKFYEYRDCCVHEPHKLTFLLEEAQQQAENYISRMGSMSSVQMIETYNPQYWESLYSSIWQHYWKSTEGKSPLHLYLEKRGDVILDWYVHFEQMREVIEFCIKTKRNKVLILGCGLSQLPFHLWRELKLENICSVDISPTVIQMMRKIASEVNVPCSTYDEKSSTYELRGINFYVIDIRNLKSNFPANSFDLVIDKATCDSLWLEDAYSKDEPSKDQLILDKGEENLKTIQEQVYHVLKKKGTWLVFSNYDDLSFNLTSSQMDIERADDLDKDLFIYKLCKR